MSVALSICITACDEEEELGRCLDALEGAGLRGETSEIVVLVDAKSGDGTLEVARARADRVDTHPYDGDVAQKGRCASMAGGEWLLVVDPDEVVSPALGQSVLGVVQGGSRGLSASAAEGFELDRVTHHLGRWIRHGDYYPDWTLRLVRGGAWRYDGEDPHGRLVVSGRVERLKGELEHHSYRDLSDQIARIQFFSDEAAAAMFARGRRSRWSDLLLRPLWRIVRALALRGGWRDGRAGVVIAGATAFHVFLKYAKLWELEQGRRAGTTGPRTPANSTNPANATDGAKPTKPAGKAE